MIMTDDLPEVRKEHPYLMYEMLKDTPNGIRKTLDTMKRESYDFLSDRLFITGNGTAYHSSTLGAQALWESGRHWRSIQSFELEHYYTPSGTLVGFSHTGKTKSTVDSMKAADRNVKTVGISHYPDTPLLEASQHSIVIGNSPDMSLCNTKAFFDNAFAALELSSVYGNLGIDTQDFMNVVERSISDLEKPVAEAVQELRKPRDIFVLGAGPSLIAAREAAQKIKESTHLHAEGIELEEFNHGCTSVIDDSSLVIIINSGEVKQRTGDIVKACKTVETQTLVINGPGDFSIDMEEMSNPYLYPIQAMVPLYYSAYYLALKMGVNPDYLRFEDKRYLEYDNIVFPPGAH